MKFYWKGFTENDFVNYCTKMRNGKYYEYDFIGCIAVGDLCFDLILRMNMEDQLILTYDCYVGGVDSGYAYGKDNYPYDECGGGDFENNCTNMTYKNFQKYAEKEFEDFIINNTQEYKETDLLEKANEELHIW